MCMSKSPSALARASRLEVDNRMAHKSLSRHKQLRPWDSIIDFTLAVVSERRLCLSTFPAKSWTHLLGEYGVAIVKTSFTQEFYSYSTSF
jgi:hypothetical protein